jgi:hypothetical protein
MQDAGGIRLQDSDSSRVPSLGRAERTSVGDEASWCMTALRLCWILDTGRLRYVSRHSPAGTQKPTFLPCTCETVFTMYSIHWEGPR